MNSTWSAQPPQKSGFTWHSRDHCHCSPVINVDLLRNKSDTWDLPFSFLKVNDLLRKIGPQSLGFSDSICAWLYRLSCGLLKDSSSSVLNCLSDVGFWGQNLAVKEDPEGYEPCFNILSRISRSQNCGRKMTRAPAWGRCFYADGLKEKIVSSAEEAQIAGCVVLGFFVHFRNTLWPLVFPS